ncbi:MAG: hypothetical protein AAGK04_10615 [Planctomycetota bacterium]
MVVRSEYRGILIAIAAKKHSWHVQLQLLPDEGCDQGAFEYLKTQRSDIDHHATEADLLWDESDKPDARRNITIVGEGGYDWPTTEWGRISADVSAAFAKLDSAVAPLLANAAAAGNTHKVDRPSHLGP